MFSKYYGVAGITLEVRSEYPITADTFHPKFKQFEVTGPGEDNVIICHMFHKDIAINYDGYDQIYFRPPWVVYNKEDRFIYQWVEVEPPYRNYFRTVVTNKEHSHLDIFNDEHMREKFLAGALSSLTMFPTDQILLGRLLAFRGGCIVHSLGIILDGHGYLFIGHSNAGKSTMARMVAKEAVILCDDRNIIRKVDNELKVYGTWSHGDVPDISALSAPLKGIFFLEKSNENEMIRVNDAMAIIKVILGCLIRPLATRDWWDCSMELLYTIIKTTPIFRLKFNKQGGVLDLLRHYGAELEGKTKVMPL